MKIRVRVKPNSKKGPMVAKSSDEIGEILEIFTREPAVDGRANLAVQEILAEFCGVSKSKISLRKGKKSKIKIFEVED
ncbi:MAG: DUF167 domain-containing protein [bacterium]|nr:DUF167 domain-containing protein [bacterium]